MLEMLNEYWYGITCVFGTVTPSMAALLFIAGAVFGFVLIAAFPKIIFGVSEEDEENEKY